MKRPYKQGQTRWVCWSQLDKDNKHETVVKPIMIVSCRQDTDLDYLVPHWHTVVRLYPTSQRGQPAIEHVTDLSGVLTFKTYRKAKRVKDEWDSIRKAHEADETRRLEITMYGKPKLATQAGVIREIF